MESPPWALSGGTATYPAEQTRRAMFAWAARTAANSPGIIAGGLLSPTDMQLSAAPSGLVVNISVGECLIGGTEGGVQGAYYARNASTSSVTLATANATNPRIDAVVGMVGDAGYTLPSGSTSGQVTLVGVTGTPTAGATLSNLNGAPAIPASSLLLGYVLVPAAALNLVSGDIANEAQLAAIGTNNVPLYGVGNTLTGTVTSGLGSTGGGLLSQAASISSTFTSGIATITFPRAFPRALLGVWFTPILGAVQPASLAISATSYGLSGCNVQASINGTTYSGLLTFSYLALGA